MHSTVKCLFWSAPAKLMIAIALLASAGCAGRNVGSVSGRVTFQGKPVVSGSVVMAPQQGPPVTSNINDDGTYTCNNVPAGPVKIGVVSPNDALEARERQAQKPGLKGMGDTPKFDLAKWFPIPSKYANYMASPLTFDVKVGENSYDIVLEP
jgi:hypothetical protein